MVDTPGRITLSQIEVFVAVAEEPSITAAASRLGGSASSVSQQLANLEAALGAKLMDRTARPMTLTQAGDLFLRRAQAILHEAAQAKSELTSNALAAGVRLRLGVIEDFDVEITPGLLTHLASAMPQAQFFLETAPSHRLFDKLESRALDMIVMGGAGDLPNTYEVHPIMQDPFVVITPKNRFDAGKSLASQLREVPLIQYTSRHVMGRQIEAYLGSNDLVISNRYELDSYHAILAMVANGEGWTIITPLGAMRARRFMDQLDYFPLPFGALSRQISLVSRREANQQLPVEITQTLRSLLSEGPIDFCLGYMPFLKGEMRVL